MFYTVNIAPTVNVLHVFQVLHVLHVLNMLMDASLACWALLESRNQHNRSTFAVQTMGINFPKIFLTMGTKIFLTMGN